MLGVFSIILNIGRLYKNTQQSNSTTRFLAGFFYVAALSFVFFLKGFQEAVTAKHSLYCVALIIYAVLDLSYKGKDKFDIQFQWCLFGPLHVYVNKY